MTYINLLFRLDRNTGLKKIKHEICILFYQMRLLPLNHCLIDRNYYLIII